MARKTNSTVQSCWTRFDDSSDPYDARQDDKDNKVVTESDIQFNARSQKPARLSVCVTAAAASRGIAHLHAQTQTKTQRRIESKRIEDLKEESDGERQRHTVSRVARPARNECLCNQRRLPNSVVDVSQLAQVRRAAPLRV
jgi:hypothetical protein